MTMLCEASRPSAADEGYGGVSSFWSRAEVVQMNLCFADAMLAARRNGLEKFTIGPIVDKSSLLATHYSPVMLRSGLSSSGNLCAEAGESGRLGSLQFARRPL